MIIPAVEKHHLPITGQQVKVHTAISSYSSSGSGGSSSGSQSSVKRRHAVTHQR
jgi:hypothetical protein